MKRGYVVDMDEKNKCRTLMGPAYRMMDGGKIWPTVQYKWSGWLMNMPIHTRGDSCNDTQIGVTFEK